MFFYYFVGGSLCYYCGIAYYGDEFIWIIKFGYYFLEIFFNSVKGFCKIKKGGVEVYVLFLVFFLELFSCKDYVYCVFVSTKVILIFR